VGLSFWQRCHLLCEWLAAVTRTEIGLGAKKSELELEVLKTPDKKPETAIFFDVEPETWIAEETND
jgi:hypothetical protein